ncbi:hypothetical protein L195_g024168 [Trifolium pratense]|uniref:Uncharacterized protein n=1 Tax=Trifolium pratense TaxID=57577 RepID=A0A2K3NCW4_TRIPR|nr:hypothetical protein L195_g024168 [Trifolium pratense]
MAEEEDEEVTYTVKITVTLTIPPPPQTQQPTTVNGDEVARAMDGGAEIILLSDEDDGSVKGDVVVIEDSDSDREKQDMNIGTETASLKDDEGSIEGDDVAVGDNVPLKGDNVTQAINAVTETASCYG